MDILRAVILFCYNYFRHILQCSSIQPYNSDRLQKVCSFPGNFRRGHTAGSWHEAGVVRSSRSSTTTMLGAQQLHWNILSFKITSWLQIIPVSVKSDGSVKPPDKVKLLHILWIIVSTVHCANLGFRFFQYIPISANRNKFQYFPLHMICFLGGTTSTIWNVRLFLQFGQLGAKILNETLVMNNKKGELRLKPQGCSIHEKAIVFTSILQAGQRFRMSRSFCF